MYVGLKLSFGECKPAGEHINDEMSSRRVFELSSFAFFALLLDVFFLHCRSQHKVIVSPLNRFTKKIVFKYVTLQSTKAHATRDFLNNEQR